MKFKNIFAGLVIGATCLQGAYAQNGAVTVDHGSSSVAANVMKDAQTRTDSGSGHDAGGFFIGSSDGFRLNVGGALQFRYALSFNRDSTSNGDDFENGFEIPLARLSFSGMLNNNIDYRISAAFSDTTSDSGDFNLEDAYFGFNLSGGNLRFGQFRLPFMYEVLVDETRQLATTRSAVAEVFGQGRSQGVQYSFGTNQFRFALAFSDGFNTDNTNFSDSREADYCLTGRVEWSPDRGNVNSFTGDGDGFVFGLAGNWQDGNASGKALSYTGDINWNSGALGLFAAGVGRHDDDFDDFGVVGQVSYRVLANTEPFVRYDAVFADSARGLSEDNFNFITAGFNQYIGGHAAKFTADAVYSVNDTTGISSIGNFSNTGLLESMNDGEVAVRAQFQVLF